MQFLPKERRTVRAEFNYSGVSVSFSDTLPRSKSSQRKRLYESSTHHTESKSLRIGIINPVLKRGSEAPPCSLTVSDMLKLRKLRTDTCSTVIDVFEFNINLLSWDQVPKVVEFNEDKKCLGSGGFQRVYKATSSHPAFVGSSWVIKRYLSEAETCIAETGQCRGT